ncbi:MAG: RND-type NFE family putative nodulcation factor export system membrane fusion component [Idiomarinaceae bacterium HL-53]|nr:MAG: RND-type NFE family putative nodulcation factor export system membrane fusion component [Idiomarinaceae bacterium HL-53]CUS48685.1 RND family efflux transporter, MFP subunit [Idiomarinaceae bacterium HL-53]
MDKKRIVSFGLAIVGLVLMFTILAGSWISKVDSDLLASTSTHQQAEAIAQRVSIPHFRHFSGQLQARQVSSVAARITARVADVLVDAGDSVRAGDVLLRLENDDLSARVRQQEQALAGAQARANEARSTFQRTQSLVAQGLLPSANLDEAVAARDTAEAELSRAREALAEAQTSENFSVIVAPFDGVVSERNVFTGDIAAPGMTLVGVYAPDSLRLEADVSESALRAIGLGNVIAVHLDALDRTVQGVVNEIEPAADPGSRSFTVRISLAETNELYPGMYGEIRVAIADRERLMIPKRLVSTLGQLNYAYVLNNDSQRERRFIRLGETFEYQNEPWVEILAGVQVGESLLKP